MNCGDQHTIDNSQRTIDNSQRIIDNSPIHEMAANPLIRSLLQQQTARRYGSNDNNQDH
jgi:hypothetical protein